MAFKLRTRRFNDLTNYEIEKYLEENDIIFIPVGNCEAHAGYPVDAEFVMAEGWAKLLAERCDGLYLPSAVYFNPGGTQIGRGTIHVSMSESFNYSKELAHSLFNQGFKRQVWIPSHVPSTDFLVAMLTEFFDETKVPMLYMDVQSYLANVGAVKRRTFEEMMANTNPVTIATGEVVNPFDDVMIAGYKLTGRLDIVPAKGEVDFPEVEKPEGFFPEWFPEYRLLSMCSNFMCAPAPYYYSSPDEHIGPPIAEYTREELEERARIGIAYMNEALDRAKLPELMLALRHLQEFEAEVARKHYDHLPKNRFSPVSPF